MSCFKVDLNDLDEPKFNIMWTVSNNNVQNGHHFLFILVQRARTLCNPLELTKWNILVLLTRFIMWIGHRAKLPTLHNRRLQDVAILMYKVKNDLVPSYISEIFTRKDTSYNLRNNNFDIQRFNSIRYGKDTLRCKIRNPNSSFIWRSPAGSMLDCSLPKKFRNISGCQRDTWGWFE